MINKVPEKIIGNINPERGVEQKCNAKIVAESSQQIINQNSQVTINEEQVEHVLAEHSITTGLLSTVLLTGGWFYLVKHIQENQMTTTILVTTFIYAILTLVQIIIWVTYFVLISQKDDKNANIVLGDWSGSVVITPLLSLICVIFLFMFGIINKI